MKKGKNNIRVQMLKRFSILFVVILSSVTFFVSTNSYKVMLLHTVNSKKDELTLINQRLASVLSFANALDNIVYYDNGLYKIVEKETISSDENDIMTYQLKLLKGKYKALLGEFGIGYDFILISENGLQCYSGTGYNGIDYKNLYNESWLQDSIKEKNITGYVVDKKIHSDSEDSSYFIHYRNIFSVIGDEYLGTFFIIIPYSYFKNSYSKLKYDLGDVFIFDSNNDLFSDISGVQLKENQNRAKDMVLQEDVDYKIDEGYLITKKESDETGWTVVEVLSLENLNDQLLQLVVFTIIICVIAFVIGMMLIWILSNKLTKPLREFCEVLENEEIGKKNTIYKKKHNMKEIEQLYASFDKMNKKNTDLMEKLMKNEEEKRKTEVNYLRAQINPHFIYNTLFSIKCTIDMKKNEEAVKMIDLLNSMLRQTLQFKEEIATVGEEIIYIHNYIKIMQYSYEKSIKFVTDVEPEAQNLKILRFIVQPLVENAIFHGIQPKNEDGIIMISAKRNHDLLELVVYDNGMGIPAEKIRKIFSTGYEKMEIVGHIGIQNINNRIRQFYGEGYGLTIDSDPGEGTMVYLIFPIEE